MQWNFSKLPAHEHAGAIKAYREGRVSELIRLHNEYRLSANRYCCLGAMQMVVAWWKYGIENNLIHEHDTGGIPTEDHPEVGGIDGDTGA